MRSWIERYVGMGSAVINRLRGLPVFVLLSVTSFDVAA
jgi:hypothetical protein